MGEWVGGWVGEWVGRWVGGWEVSTDCYIVAREPSVVQLVRWGD